jgi:hypothetical protein
MANIKHVLVAADLTDRSERACERGIRLAREQILGGRFAYARCCLQGRAGR